MKPTFTLLRPSIGSGHFKYSPLADGKDEFYNEYNCDKYDDIQRYDLKYLRTRIRLLVVAMVVGIVGIIWSLFMYSTIANSNHSGSQPCDSVDLGFWCYPKLTHFWGQYSPYFSIPSEIATGVPGQCHITFAQMLSRHGARDPSSRSTIKYRRLIDKIHSNATSYSDSFAFVKDFKYKLGADQLSQFGEQQMVNSGIKFYNRYSTSVGQAIPFIRSSGQTRVIASAVNWTQGFHKARMQDLTSKSVSESPYKIIIISEESGSNNTLDHGLCTEFEEGSVSKIGHSAMKAWASIFAPNITKRLNSNIPGVNFTVKETIYMMDLCPFETVADKQGKLSPFCFLFSEKEWQAYDYFQSLGKYYGYSSGNPLGPTQGVGFVNELIARMTNSPVNDHTTTNSTLDSDPSTFPVSRDITLFADFSHDNTMTSIFAALGLYNSTAMLKNTTLVDAHNSDGYSASWTVPFAARAYFEKMICPDIDEELVRIIVNDRVIPLSTCGADNLGRCTLSSFVKSLTFARNGGSWDQC